MGLRVPNGELRVVDSVPEAFARLITQELLTMLASDKERPMSFFLSGGPTARACYEMLAASSAKKIEWDRVDIYWGDERCVPAEDPDSNALMARHALLERIGPVAGVHPMSCEKGPGPYQALIEALPGIDLVHLGMGPDGHTASLFSGVDALQASARELVAITEDPAARNPHKRITLTLPAIARARLVVFTISGKEKREAFTALCSGADLPASKVRAARVIWIADRAATG